MGDVIRMSEKERRRLVEVVKVVAGEQSAADAARKLHLSVRQMRRSVRRHRLEGDGGLCHRSRGRPSNRAKDGEEKRVLLEIYEVKLMGWGPKHASEKLAEMVGRPVDDETLRRWLLGSGLWKRSRKRDAHRRWREPKGHFGELVQMDGSYHDWFGTGEMACLMNMVDDSTGRSFALFFEHETTGAAMRVLRCWIERYGVPCALYTDRHTIYHTDREPTVEEIASGSVPLTAFGKACRKLGIKIIPASSPQAKGRVERKHGVYQDRLVKEMRLLGIGTIGAANDFLLSGYLDDLNLKFERAPASPVDYHRPVGEGVDLDEVFSFEEGRKVGNDWTVRYKNRIFQIGGPGRGIPPAKGQVVVQERLDGSLHIYYRGKDVGFHELPARPAREVMPAAPPKRGKKWVPAPDHPWRGRSPALRVGAR